MAHPLSFKTDPLQLLIRGLADLLFPPRCLLCRKNVHKIEICSDCLEGFRPLSSPLCSICGTEFKTGSGEDHPCGACIKDIPSFDGAASMFIYNDAMKEAVHFFKYKGKSILSRPLGNSLAQHHLSKGDYDAILPVPLYIKRLRNRGYNQSQLLAVELGRIVGIKVDPWLLKRARPTLSQTGMKRNERIKNLKGAFMLRKGSTVKGMKLLLIDDVYTTGSTVEECAKVLKKGGAKKVNVLTLARVAEL